MTNIIRKKTAWRSLYTMGLILAFAFASRSVSALSGDGTQATSNTKAARKALIVDPKLSGTVIGTAGSYQNDPNRAKESVYDNTLSTFFDNCDAGAWAGLDLSSSLVISKIRYYARDPFPSRMVNGKFQGSNTADFSSGVVDLHTITSQPAIQWIDVIITNPNAYRYVRYLGPASSCANVAEVEFYGASVSSGDSKLSGTVIGTSGSFANDPNTTKDKVYDNNTSSFFDNCDNGAWAGLDLGATNKVSKIRYFARNPFPDRMVNGKFQGSNTADFSSGVVDLHTITSQPPLAWITVSISNTTGFRYLRYLGPSNGCANVAEVAFYGVAVSTADPKLSGTVIGTPGSFANDPNTTRDKVYDNNTSSYFDNCDNGAWAGLDLSTPYTISKIRYFARNFFPERMNNGKFQGSNTADFSSGVVDLHTITTQPPVAWVTVSVSNTVGFRYVRYLGPSNGCANVAEVEFYGAASGSGGGDTAAPSVPASLTSSSVGQTSFTLTWAASTDNVGVTGYEVFKGGVSIATPSGTSYTVTGLTCNTSNSMQVRARDAAGNWSALSASSAITTSSCGSSNDPKLAGAVIGTPGSLGDNPDVTREKVFDGDIYSFFDNCSADTWAGLDLGSSTTYKITKVRFHPRTGAVLFPDRMIQGKFQGSNSASFSGTVTDLAVVSARPLDGWNEIIITIPYGFRYVRYLSPGGSCGNVAEVEFYGSPASVASDNAAPTVPSGFSASAVNTSSVTVSWNAAIDNVGVTGYEVYRNGRAIIVINNTTFTIPGGCGTTYAVQVRAKDAVGNWSALSSAFSASTSGCPAGTGTVGGGSDQNPAVGPAASYNLADGYALVKNWDWGLNGTIRNMTEMSSEFMYHDNFGTIGNGTNYGSKTVAADDSTAIGGQRVEDPLNPIREITATSMKTYLQPFDNASVVKPDWYNVGNGSFGAKWELPNGGSLLGRDVVWETRMRYVVPQQYWWALWIVGDYWDRGAEIDLVEGFGYDNGCGAPCTNFDGRYWHSGSIDGPDDVGYGDWNAAMTSVGFPAYDPTQYHTWTLVYRADNSYDMYCDGVRVQGGAEYWWTRAHVVNGIPIDMSFLFDGAWGHTQIASVNKELPASTLVGKYYEYDYSRVYLGPEVSSLAHSSTSARQGSSETTSLSQAGFSVYPNPVKETLNVSLPEQTKGSVEVRIFDMTGKLYHTSKTEGGKDIRIDTGGMPQGVYLIRVIANGGVHSQTFVK